MLFDEAVAEGYEQFHQFVDLRLELLPFVGVAHTHAALTQLHDLRGADDVGAVEHGVLGRRKGFVLHELESAAMEYERIARYARCLVICLRKTSVYHHKLSVGL